MDVLIDNVHLATMTGERPYGAVEGGAVAIDDGRIAWIGDGPRPDAERRIDAGGRWMTPALIDCHTHLVYGGQRAAEFEQRLGGRSYADIAGGGGGILSTVRATRAADEEQLLAAAVRRAGAMLGQGVTVVEVKSGYGLERDSELRMLRVATRLGQSLPITVRRTFLGAHALPTEFAGDGDGYIASVCDDMLPAAVDAGLVDAVDAFCETIAFSAGQTRRVFERARSLGLPVKLHADQLSDSGGAALAASFGALSADHIEYTGEDGVRAMATAGTVAVLLPGAFYYLGETRLPPVERLREHGVPMAVASDCNPGSSPTTSLLLMLNMACTLFRLTPEEALAGVTRNAARALGLDASHGTLSVGKAADFVLWDIDNPAELAYTIGMNPCHQVWRGGRIVHEAEP